MGYFSCCFLYYDNKSMCGLLAPVTDTNHANKTIKQYIDIGQLASDITKVRGSVITLQVHTLFID